MDKASMFRRASIFSTITKRPQEKGRAGCHLIKMNKLSLLALVIASVQFTVQSEFNKDDVAFAEVHSCEGCQLRGLPGVKEFIFEDLPLYDRVEFKSIRGAPPELLLLDNEKSELERIPLRDYTRLGCNELMEKYGFKKRPKNEL
ncbi:Sep15/SelM redox domain [Nesidiocoris tenuis]|uniref:Selenoprotein M n=1 Tax=Nesidiocoris tenuis TaxID=355587 RepID=A0ABN7AZU1_9HEMI|nr:Sep15/SelM redox domain [Nesidiocoris tenuis]